MLAAGASTRMGRPKQLIEIDGKTLLVRTVEAALQTPVWPVVVVLGAHAAEVKTRLIRYPLLIAENAAWVEGMASSIRTGMSTLHSFSRAVDQVVICLCDQPHFSAGTIYRLLEARAKSNRSIVAAHYRNRLGAPALFSAASFPALASLSGDEGARHLLVQASLTGDVEAVDLPELAVDLDTPGDIERLLQSQKEVKES